MKIRIAKTDTEIAACYPVLRELRPHITESEFLSRVRAQEKGGYLLAFVQEASGPVAVAGFRIGENLAWGRFLYVDDLVTHPTFRSKAMGPRSFPGCGTMQGKTVVYSSISTPGYKEKRRTASTSAKEWRGSVIIFVKKLHVLKGCK